MSIRILPTWFPLEEFMRGRRSSTMSLGNDQVKTLNTFFVWPTHLVQPFLEHGLPKPVDMPNPDVEPLYMMALTIPQLFLKLLQMLWDATMFEVYNDHFALHIKHEDLSKIAHSVQCLGISLTDCFKFMHYLLYFNNNRHMTETSMRAGNASVYEFLKP
ncbi:hypothetical protein GmHk_17G049682 [Glycine max]|nr:hypothetical protein GmHk_17G049682 [Glycine max]